MQIFKTFAGTSKSSTDVAINEFLSENPNLKISMMSVSVASNERSANNLVVVALVFDER